MRREVRKEEGVIGSSRETITRSGSAWCRVSSAIDNGLWNELKMMNFAWPKLLRFYSSYSTARMSRFVCGRVFGDDSLSDCM